MANKIIRQETQKSGANYDIWIEIDVKESLVFILSKGRYDSIRSQIPSVKLLPRLWDPRERQNCEHGGELVLTEGRQYANMTARIEKIKIG